MLLFASFGTLLAFLLALPAMRVEWKREPSAHPVFVDMRWFGGQVLSHRESFLLGVLLHVLMGAGFGAGFVASTMWVRGIIALPFVAEALYTFVWFLVVNVLLFPALGIGVCGRREGLWVWLETAVSLLVVACGCVALRAWVSAAGG